MDLIAIKNPIGNKDKTYLYNVILRNQPKDHWKSVNHVIETNDSQLKQRLLKRDIEHFFIGNGDMNIVKVESSGPSREVESVLNKLVELMVEAKIDSSKYGIEFSESDTKLIMEIANKIQE